MSLGWILFLGFFKSLTSLKSLGILDLLLVWWWPFDNLVIIFLDSCMHLSVILVQVFGYNLSFPVFSLYNFFNFSFIFLPDLCNFGKVGFGGWVHQYRFQCFLGRFWESD